MFVLVIVRTRAGKYRDQTLGRNDESRFRLSLNSIQDKILESADLKKTDFYGKSMEQCAKHFQHTSVKARRSVGGGDNFHSPVQPNQYVEWRLKNENRFYAKRIPVYGLYSRASQAIIIGGSLVQSVLAFTDTSGWAPLISSFVAAVSAWMIFGGTNDKMERYSNTLHTLGALETWWRTMPNVEQQSVFNIDKLIVTCEDIIKSERQAWFATAVDLKTSYGASAKSENENKNQEDRGEWKISVSSAREN